MTSMMTRRTALAVSAVSLCAGLLVGCGQPGSAKSDEVTEAVPPAGQLPELPASYFPPPPTSEPDSAPQTVTVPPDTPEPEDTPKPETVTQTVPGPPPPPPPPKPEPGIQLPRIPLPGF